MNPRFKYHPTRATLRREANQKTKAVALFLLALWVLVVMIVASEHESNSAQNQQDIYEQR